MNIGRRADYALRAICYIAAQSPERQVSRSEIQQRQGIPPHFLSKILRSLVSAGLLRSVPGVRGGFSLGRDAHQISVRAVYESVEGPLCLVECLDRRQGFCQFAPVCTQRDIWIGAQHVLAAYLDTISIDHIAEQYGLVNRLEKRKTERCVAPSRVA
jgi:Rrf2 family protein